MECVGEHVSRHRGIMFSFFHSDEMSVRFDGEFEHFLNFARQYYYIHFISLSFVMVNAT
jgi:hypothetical protein